MGTGAQISEAIGARKNEMMEVSVKAGQKIKTIKTLLAISAVTGLAGIDTAAIEESAKALNTLRNRFVKLLEDIDKLEEELGR